MKVYAVIDTNVLVSAMITRNSDAATVQVVELLFSGKITPLFNEEILNEYSEVLHRAKFHLPKLLIDRVLSEIRSVGISLHRTTAQEILPDPKDVVFYEIALSKEGSFLVTGNTKHFPNTPIVVTPARILEIICNG